MLVSHATTKPASFHVPGHHNSESLHLLEKVSEQTKEITDRFKPIMEIDLTEISATDDLHHPEGAIKDAQSLAAKCFGAEDTYFLVGGSTSGNLALLLTICTPGDTIIVQRNVHKSVINGLKLAGATAVFLTPQFDKTTGLATIPSLDQVETALMQYPKATAVFLTNPNYYGISIKLDAYADSVHRSGIPLIVDEAHGAHYGFHSKLPQSALAAGADAVVQSTHKTLPALTMGAMLHVQGDLIDRGSLVQSLSMIQSSSPSFPIMASLDIARAMVQTLGSELFQPVLDAVNSFNRWVNNEQLIVRTVNWDEELEAENIRQLDPLRVLLYDQTGHLSGYELLKELEQHGCWAEMADLRYVVLVMGIHMTEVEIGKLRVAITSIHSKYNKSGAIIVMGTGTEKSSSTEIILKDSSGIGVPVSFARDHIVKREIASMQLRQCEGLQSAEMIVPYPPGIPLVYVGERLTVDTISQIESLATAGAKFQGADNTELSTIKVFIDQKRD
ncbi:aminotransferase class I/II-fold pyridoxal phosphate-dependent enzyme [Paenibacillus sp. GSMTC-2017]|nr:aminotransferase class I/II-fold pyridoxal phosphate-dependent enzyme [Paenibacillus sp. GSMTC-2017]